MKVGTASSARVASWQAAEVYPQQTNNQLALTDQQRAALRPFISPTSTASQRLQARRTLDLIAAHWRTTVPVCGPGYRSGVFVSHR